MKSLVIAASLIVTLFSCKQTDNAVTPADGVPGEYAITGTASYTVEGAVSTSPLSGTLSVYAGNLPNTYYFVERYSTSELAYLTQHNSSTFTVEGVPDFSYVNSVKYYGYQSGSGMVAANSIKISRTANTNTATYIAPTGGVNYPTKNIRKVVSIVANK